MSAREAQLARPRRLSRQQRLRLASLLESLIDFCAGQTAIAGADKLATERLLAARQAFWAGAIAIDSLARHAIISRELLAAMKRPEAEARARLNLEALRLMEADG